jgi:superfamily II DNA/RNA helicase
MYSATFAGHVGGLARSLLRDPLRVEISSHTDTHSDIEQRLHWADDLQHKNALLDHILTERAVDQALVFTSTQRDADWLADRLADMGHAVASLHGGMPQGRRNRVLQGLRTRELRVLVATDVAARGIDVPTISHVINYGLPMKAEDYVHRIGRTGRAGRSGVAVTLAERRDSGMIQRIQRFTTQRIPVLVIAGLLLWAINAYIPMAAGVKKLLNIAVIVILVMRRKPHPTAITTDSPLPTFICSNPTAMLPDWTSAMTIVR